MTQKQRLYDGRKGYHDRVYWSNSALGVPLTADVSVRRGGGLFRAPFVAVRLFNDQFRQIDRFDGRLDKLNDFLRKYGIAF